MTALTESLVKAVAANMTWQELAALALAWALLVVCTRRSPAARASRWVNTFASGFLIVYVTLLRRTPGYLRTVRWLPVWNASSLAGYALNAALYLPLGFSLARWNFRSKLAYAISVCVAVSIGCEALQYLTARGQMDMMDIASNAIGAAVGVWVAEKLDE